MIEFEIDDGILSWTQLWRQRGLWVHLVTDDEQECRFRLRVIIKHRLDG